MEGILRLQQKRVPEDLRPPAGPAGGAGGVFLQSDAPLSGAGAEVRRFGEGE